MIRSIAIISNKTEFDKLQMFPTSRFIHIQTVKDIKGNSFEGAIFIGNWRQSKKRVKAYEELGNKYPEIFIS